MLTEVAQLWLSSSGLRIDSASINNLSGEQQQPAEQDGDRHVEWEKASSLLS
jgi:hypothetical protein